MATTTAPPSLHPQHGMHGVAAWFSHHHGGREDDSVSAASTLSLKGVGFTSICSSSSHANSEGANSSEHGSHSLDYSEDDSLVSAKVRFLLHPPPPARLLLQDNDSVSTGSHDSSLFVDDDKYFANAAPVAPAVTSKDQEHGVEVSLASPASPMGVNQSYSSAEDGPYVDSDASSSGENNAEDEDSLFHDDKAQKIRRLEDDFIVIDATKATQVSPESSPESEAISTSTRSTSSDSSSDISSFVDMIQVIPTRLFHENVPTIPVESTPKRNQCPPWIRGVVVDEMSSPTSLSSLDRTNSVASLESPQSTDCPKQRYVRTCQLRWCDDLEDDIPTPEGLLYRSSTADLIRELQLGNQGLRAIEKLDELLKSGKHLDSTDGGGSPQNGVPVVSLEGISVPDYNTYVQKSVDGFRRDVMKLSDQCYHYLFGGKGGP